MKRELLSHAATAFAIGLFLSPIALGEDEPGPGSETPSAESGPSEPEAMRKFDSRERLARLVLFEDRAELAEQKEALAEAEALLQRAIDAGADQAVIDRIQAEVDRRAAALNATREEIDRVLGLIDELSPEQVFAYNRSLNNAIASDIFSAIDFDLLKRSLGADLDKQQINALTQALEQEARFASKADRFRDRAEESGNDRWLAQADRMDARAEAQKEKFLDKVRRGNTETSGPLPAERQMREETLRYARAAARDAAQEEARRMARESARDEAREAARKRAQDEKQAARDARGEAIALARATAREEAREQGKAKGKAKKN